MIYLLILSGLFVSAGLFLLFANALKLPYLKTSKAIMNAGREDKKISKSYDAADEENGETTNSGKDKDNTEKENKLIIEERLYWKSEIFIL